MAFVITGDAATNRTNLGLGTAATLDVGSGANNIVQLDGSGNLPAIDGSSLTGIQGTTFNADDAILRFSAAEGGANSSGVTQHTSSLSAAQSTIGAVSGLEKHYVNGDCTVTSNWDGSDGSNARLILVVNGTFTINSGVTMTFQNAGAPMATNGNFGSTTGYQNGGSGAQGGGGVGGRPPMAGSPDANVVRGKIGGNTEAYWGDQYGLESSLAYMQGFVNPMNAENYAAYGSGGMYETDCSANSTTACAGGGCVIVIARKIVNNGTIDVSGGDASFAAYNCSDGVGGGGGGLISLWAFDKTSVFGSLNFEGGGWTNGNNSTYGAGPGGWGLFLGGIY
jgi:hypothetical protein